MDRKSFILTLLTLLISGLSYAQHTVTGSVHDASTLARLDYVNVVLEQGGKPIDGTITDTDGQFALVQVKDGTYDLVVSFMGYTTLRRSITVKGKNVSLGKLTIDEDTQALDEVEVVAQGTTVRFELDRKIFSVDQNLAAAGGSASEALENLPSVDVDQEGNISLRGSESVEIWINGKPSGLTAENRADVLRQMPAESIKEIELITNPSAKFSPEGTSGVINIVMKKDRKAGYYGSLTAGLEYGLAKPWNVPPGANASLNINFSKGIVDGYANVGYRFHTRNGGNESERYMLHGSGTRYLDDIPADSIYSVLRADGHANSRGHNMFVRAGLNIHAGEYSTIGISGFAIASDPQTFRSHDNNETEYVQTNYRTGDTTRLYTRTETGGGWHPGGNVVLDYTLKIQKHQLMMSAMYNHWTWNSDQTYTTRTGESITSEQRQKSDNRDQSVEIKADYEWKPTQLSRLEAGYQAKISSKKSESMAYAGNELDPTKEIFDFYGDFGSREQNHAIYITYGNKFWNRLSLQVGLRGEIQTRHMESYYKDHNTGEIVDAYNAVPNKRDTMYFQVYPSVYISYDFGKGNELQINYTRRVDRPWGHTLNPRQNIADSTNISCGNPDLLPSYSNNMELNYLKMWERHTLSVGAFWRYKEGIVQNLTFMDGPQMRNTWVNAGNRHDVGGEITVKNRFFGEVMQMTTTLECYYNTMKGGDYDFLYAGRPYTVSLDKQSAVTWSAKLQMNFLFTKTFSGQIGGRYRSPRALAQGYTTHSYNIDLGLRKTFLDKKLALAFNVRDILDSRARRSTTWGDGFWQNSQRRWHSRTVSLTLTYNFGNMKKKNNEKGNYNSNDSAGAGFDDGAGAEGGLE